MMFCTCNLMNYARNVSSLPEGGVGGGGIMPLGETKIPLYYYLTFCFGAWDAKNLDNTIVIWFYSGQQEVEKTIGQSIVKHLDYEELDCNHLLKDVP